MLRKILSLTFFISVVFVNAQEKQEKGVQETEQKIGLVLSGGGAKGLAHIGVLKVIDSLGIKIDYIGGTSMGAIVGGLYASGYSGKQLDSIFNSIDLGTLIQDEFPRSAKTFYEKEDSERYAITVPFENFKVTLPTALSKGQNVFNLMAQLTEHVSEVRDFNELPIPFFCVATNVESGQAVILDSGYLPDAMSASGTFPTLFEPVKLNGQLLIDGGVTNNYPIDEVKAMGATVIIGVDVQDALRDREQLKSFPEILLQINNYRTVKDMELKSQHTDVYIDPDISDFNVISFEDGEEIINNGYQAAVSQTDQLKKLLVSQGGGYFREPLKMAVPEIKITQVDIVGDQKYPRGYVLGKLRFKTPTTISYEKLDQGINNLAATGNFESIRYRFQKTEDGNKLIMDINQNQNTSFIRLGVHYDDLYKSAALVNFTKKRLFFDNDVTSLDLILGDNLRYNFEYYIDKGVYWSIGLRSRYNSFKKNVLADFIPDQAIELGVNLNQVDLDVTDFTNQFYLETVFREEFSIGIGAEHKRIKYATETIAEGEKEEVVFENSDYGSIFGFLRFDTYDSKYFPTRGLYFDAGANLYFFSTDFNNNFSEFAMAKGKIGFAVPVAKNLALNLGSEGGLQAGVTNVNTFDFVLGGYGNNFINNFVPFIGYDFLSFAGNSFIKGTVKLDYEFTKRNHINIMANFANAGTSIYETGDWLKAPDYSGYAIGYSLKTFLGPMELKYSWSPETKKTRVFFNLGFWF